MTVDSGSNRVRRTGKASGRSEGGPCAPPMQHGPRGEVREKRGRSDEVRRAGMVALEGTVSGLVGRTAKGSAQGAEKGLPHVRGSSGHTAVRRYGEADHPGPQGGADAREATAEMTVDEAWQQASRDPSWVPAWKTWSRPRIIGADGARYRMVLEPPQGLAEMEAVGQEEPWEEEELERFLQQCEVEAGLREQVEVNEGQRLAQEWRDWEAEMTLAGIQCPRTEEDAAGCRCLAAEDAEVFEAPSAPLGTRATREANGEANEKKKKRRRWRPVNAAQKSGEPRTDPAGEDFHPGPTGGGKG